MIRRKNAKEWAIRLQKLSSLARTTRVTYRDDFAKMYCVYMLNVQVISHLLPQGRVNIAAGAYNISATPAIMTNGRCVSL
jgi:hypothetical protein